MKAAVIGDIHNCFNEKDTDYLNNSDYDYVFLVGDLPSHSAIKRTGAFQHLQNIEKPAYMIPGNWDGPSFLRLICEACGYSSAPEFGDDWQNNLARKLKNITISAYESFRLNDSISLLTARPFSMGGHKLNFTKKLSRFYNIHSLEDSAEKIIETGLNAETDHLLILSHNGPSGLGSHKESIFGADFKKAGGDFGDSDLETAITELTNKGKNIIAVLSGHMHYKTTHDRTWQVEKDGTLYVNSAMVPRIVKHKNSEKHFFIELAINADLESRAEYKSFA